MNHHQKQATRMAARIRDQLIARNNQLPAINLPNGDWTGVQQLLRKIERASDHGWDAAQKTLIENLRYQFDILQCRINETALVLQRHRDHPAVPSQSSIYGEIQWLYHEFPSVECDVLSCELSVTTEPIVLDGTHLGSFKICLDVSRLGQPSPYRVIALDPYPAASNEGVTHPHVQDETLCEGEGRSAIRTALAAGRIGDFFVIVNQTLSTYARGDAYVELSNWQGRPCCDCGSLTQEDDYSICEQCGDSLCSDCAVFCLDCEDPHCSQCLTEWSVMFILARGGQTYARMRFQIGPGGSVELPVEVDYCQPFAGSDRAAWQKEYETNVRVAQMPLLAQRGTVFGNDHFGPFDEYEYDDWADAWQDYTDEDQVAVLKEDTDDA